MSPEPREALMGVQLETLHPGPEHELDAAGYQRIRAGDAQPETLYSAWIDAEHGRLPAGWIARVAARTAELAEGGRGQWILPMADALDRCFGALSVGAVPASVAAPFGTWDDELGIG